jgi:hypothetical protein
LEKFGLEIAGNQQATQESRKQLAEQTKEFRRLLSAALEQQPPHVVESINGAGFQRLLKGQSDMRTKHMTHIAIEFI